jgi:hypothetical protein
VNAAEGEAGCGSITGNVRAAASLTDTFADSRVRHGTQSGWRLHQDRGERPCDPCYFAKQAYDQRRKEVPQERIRNRLHARAQTIANQRLKELYPDLYRVFYLEAKARLLVERADEFARADS